MNYLQLAFAVFFFLLGAVVIPRTLDDARSPLAPYRAIRGAFYLLIGAFFWLRAIGVVGALVISS